MKILVMNGPNLNMLGKRDAAHYGTLTLEEIVAQLRARAKELSENGGKVELLFFQSNHEGALIDFIQQHSESVEGILINPGALTHYSYALRDALSDVRLPIVEVHLSNIQEREEFRKISVIREIAVDAVVGLKEKSYIVGLEKLVEHVEAAKR